MIHHINTENFESEVLRSDKPVLLDFWASWCGPCQMLAPVLDEIAAEREDIKVCKVNVDEEKDLARAYKIFSIPTVMVVKNGEVTQRSMGVRPKEELLSLL